VILKQCDSRFKYKLAAMYILSAVCIYLSRSVWYKGISSGWSVWSVSCRVIYSPTRFLYLKYMDLICIIIIIHIWASHHVMCLVIIQQFALQEQSGSLVSGVIPVHSCRKYDWSPVRLSVCLCYILVRYTSADSNRLDWLGVPPT
jgi:hypothetical protein